MPPYFAKKKTKRSPDRVKAARQMLFKKLSELSKQNKTFDEALSDDSVSLLVKNLEEAYKRGGDSMNAANKKDLDRAKPKLAAGLAKLDCGQTQDAKKKYIEAVAYFHEVLQLLPVESASATQEEKELRSKVYCSLAKLYNQEHLKNRYLCEKYNMLWLRKYAPFGSNDDQQENAKLLFDSYIVAMKNGIKKLDQTSLVPNKSEIFKRRGEIRRARAKAEDCLLAEAVAYYQLHPRLFSYLLTEYKKIKTTLNNKHSVLDSFNLVSQSVFEEKAEAKKKKKEEKQKKKQANLKFSPTSNVLTRTKLDSNGYFLRAQSEYKRGRVVFYEPVITAFWTSSRCGQCAKPLPGIGIQCTKCSRVSFCSVLCSSLSQYAKEPFNGHSERSCLQFNGNGLTKNQSFLYNLLANCGQLDSFLGLISNENGIKSLPTLTEECLPTADDQVPSFMAALLVCKRAETLNDAGFDPWCAAEMKHLALILKAKDNQQKLLYKLLYFFKICPQANISLSSRNKKTEGYALGAFGGLLQYSCKPNIQRRLNRKTGMLEYVATKTIAAGSHLALGLNGVSNHNFKNKYKLSCICNSCNSVANA